MLLIIGYIMNNERLNLGSIKSVDKKMDYFILSNSTDNGIIIDIINIMKNRKVNRFCVHLNLNDVLMIESQNTKINYGVTSIQFLTGYLVNTIGSWCALGFLEGKADVGEIAEGYLDFFAIRLGTHLLGTAPVIWGINYAFGNKKSSYKKTAIGTIIGGVISDAILLPLVAGFFGYQGNIFCFTAFFLSNIVPPIGGIIGSNL